MDNQLSTIQTKIQSLFKEATPKECVKFRKGAGGKMFPYVPIDYTLGKLDSTFGIFWEFKIIDKQIGKKQVIVQGELNIKSPSGFSVSRPGIGRKNIVFYTGTENPVDIGNDLKAAVSDAIKKAASMFGIAADIYYKEIEKYEDIQDDIDQSKEERQQRYAGFFAIAGERGIDGEAAQAWIKDRFKVKHMEELTMVQILNAGSSLEKYYEKVEKGEKPRKIGEVPKVSIPTASQEPIINAEIRGDESKQVSEIIRPELPIEAKEEAVKAESVKVDVVEDSVDAQEKEDGKPISYFCKGKKHIGGIQAQTTTDEPWCSKECQDEYYDAINKTGNSAFKKFMREQSEKKAQALALEQPAT